MAARVSSFSAIADTFLRYVRDIEYCTMVTVDRDNRPRARVMLAIWEVVDERPVGWLAVYRTPVKEEHLAHSPHTTYSYWDPRQNAVHIDAVTTWAEDPDVKERGWKLYRTGSPAGLGYDPARFWSGPADPKFHLLRIDPWRVQLVRGADLSSRIWRTDAPAAADPAA